MQDLKSNDDNSILAILWWQYYTTKSQKGIKSGENNIIRNINQNMNQSEMSMSYGIVLYIDKHVNTRIKSEGRREEKEKKKCTFCCSRVRIIRIGMIRHWSYLWTPFKNVFNVR